MKETIIAMAAIAAAFTMASCNGLSLESEDSPTAGRSVVTATIGNSLTRTALSGNDTVGYKVVWTVGDKLFVIEASHQDWYAEYTLDNTYAGRSCGTFNWQTGDMFYPFDKSYTEPAFRKGKMYTAFYPYDMVRTGTDTYFWETEQTYSTTDMYIPMVSAASECREDGMADLMFRNLGGVLRLTVKGTAVIRSITVQAGEPMSGVFVDFINDDDYNLVPLMQDETEYGPLDARHYITLDCGEAGVALSSEGTDFHISMPCHYDADGELDGYSDVVITLTDTDGDICVKKLTGRKLVIERSRITSAAFTASGFKPGYALPGKFSVAGDRQVHFSRGNLYYDGSAFWFESSQYGSWGSWNQSHVSHFSWSGNASVACAQEYSDAGAAANDVFFTNATETTAKSDFTVNGETGKYRTLSNAEWTYLFSGRSNASALYKYGVTVCGKENCIVLAPDGFIGTLADSYDASAWAAAEAKGLVCLPATGYRDGSKVSHFDSKGYYWTSSAAGGGSAYYVGFPGSNVLELNAGTFRYDGQAVRLVTDVTKQ